MKGVKEDSEGFCLSTYKFGISVNINGENTLGEADFGRKIRSSHFNILGLRTLLDIQLHILNRRLSTNVWKSEECKNYFSP